MAYNILGETEPATPSLAPIHDLAFGIGRPAQHGRTAGYRLTQNDDDLERVKRQSCISLNSPADATLPSPKSSPSDVLVGPNQHANTPPLYVHRRDTDITSPHPVTSSSTTSISSFPEEIPSRTASISHHLPLNHPKPDLQSMQGAYGKNVERLEEHAERLSMTSVLERELHGMKLERRQLRRQSSGPTTRSPPLDPSSNSITSVNAAARNGCSSPPANVLGQDQDVDSTATSSQLSNRSSSRCSQTKSARQFSYEEQDSLTPLPPSHVTPDLCATTPNDHHLSLGHRPSTSSVHEDRPPTSSSNDTYRQATSLFRDFDGTHYISAASSMVSRQPSQATRHVSLTAPPLAADSQAFKEPQPGEKMVYYPAPVPMMLELPQKISRLSNTDRERRRVAGLSALPAEVRKSAQWRKSGLSGKFHDVRHSQQTFATMPPHLRASVFFDQPSANLGNLELEDGSAVATLDKILDESKFAPVNAFVDHPFAGQVGSEIYGPPSADKRKSESSRGNRKSSGSVAQLDQQKEDQVAEKMKMKRSSIGSLSNMLGIGRRASGGTMDEMGRNFSGESRKQHVQEDIEMGKWKNLQDYANKLPDEDTDMDDVMRPGADEMASDASSVRSEAEDRDAIHTIDSELPLAFTNAPTTLLAELQMRKAKQKSRNLTAADVGGKNGMHATLLEMDAVTQLQLKSRKQKHVTLAWEDEAEAEKGNYDDDDVPLGLLFPGKQEDKVQGRVFGMGLLAQRNLEENEPLSSRRQRLHPNARSLKSVYAGSVMPREPEDEDEGGETLGERLKRLKAEKEKEQEKRAVAGEFVDGSISQLGLDVAHDGTAKKIERIKTPDPEETLGQRRQRLQNEAERQAKNDSPQQCRPAPENRHSMASLLSAHPIGRGSNARASTYSGRVVSGGSGNSLQHPAGAFAPPPFAMPSSHQYSTGVDPVHQQQFMPYTTFGMPGMPWTTPLPLQPYMHTQTYTQSHPYMNAYDHLYPTMAHIGQGQQYPMGTTGADMNMNKHMPPMTTGMNAMNIAMGPPLDPKQRDGIEQWRQSVDI